MTYFAVATTILVLHAGVTQAAVPFYQDILDGQNKTIVTMGTSLTNTNYSFWVPLFTDWIKSEAPDPGNVTVVNVAISGQASSQAIGSQLSPAKAANPDVVFIEFGMNDAYTPYDISVAQAKANLNYIIDDLETHNPNVDIVLMTMNNTKPGEPRPNLADYYQNYRDVAQDRGLLLIDHHLNWVDLYNNAPATWTSYGAGGVHPNLLGTEAVIMPQIKLDLGSDQHEPPYVTVHQQTGEIKVICPDTSLQDMDLKAYSIASASGALDADDWTSITGNYDGQGNSSVDSGNWSIVSAAAGELSEVADPGGDDGLIPIGTEVSLGVGAWLQNLTKDIEATYTDTDGNVIDLNVRYLGSDNIVADLDFDGSITVADWLIFVDNAQSYMPSLSAAQAYQLGDLDGDLDNDLEDFDLFRRAFELENPAQGAFAAMVAQAAVPEPSSFLLLLFAFGATVLLPRRRMTSVPATTTARNSSRVPRLSMVGSSGPIAVAVALFLTLLGGTLQATVVNYNFDYTVHDRTDLVGPAGGAGETWNQSMQGTHATDGGFWDDNVLDSEGNATGIDWSLKRSDDGKLYRWVGSDDATLSMLDHGIFTNSNLTNTLTLTELDPAKKYDLYITGYGGTFGNNLTNSAVNTTTTSNPQQMLQTGETANWVLNDNYIVFEDMVPDASGTLAVDSAKQSSYGFWSGFQLVEVGEPAILTLQVNRTTGNMTLLGDSTSPQDINSYQITSEGDSLDLAGWNSIFDQDDVAGGFPAGDGSGNGWEEAGQAGPHALAEVYLQGDSTVAPGASIGLGKGYDDGVDAQDLVFKYRTDLGQLLMGLVEYVTVVPDANGDGVVDAADYIIVKANMGQATGVGLADGDFNEDGTVDWGDLQILAAAMDAGAAGETIPEPATLGLLALGALAVTRRKRK